LPKLELYIPGLLAAPARLAVQLELPEVPALREWQQRSRQHASAPGRYGPLLEWLAVQHAPLAALAWYGATGERHADNSIFLATLVHFEAGMNDLVLFSGGGLEVSNEERERMARDLVDFFGDAPAFDFRQGQLFMRTPQPLVVQTVGLHDAQGKAVRGNLPRGRDSSVLHAWMNELQMFLHGHAINRERTQRRVPTLNGIWVHGEGALPLETRIQGAVVFAESLPMQGLGHLSGGAQMRGTVSDWLPARGHHVVEYADCIHALDADDAGAWQAGVARIDQECLQPLIEWLGRNSDAEAVLHAGDGRTRTLRGGRDGIAKRVFRRFANRESLRVIEE